MPETSEYRCRHPSLHFFAECRLGRFQEFCLKLPGRVKADGWLRDAGFGMDRRRLSIPLGFGQKNYAGRRPSVEDILLTAIDAKPKVFDLLVRNRKTVVLSVDDFSGCCLEFHHPKRSARLVKQSAITIWICTAHPFLPFFVGWQSAVFETLKRALTSIPCWLPYLSLHQTLRRGI
jgi:hypothetical protein